MGRHDLYDSNVNILKTKRLPSVALKAVAQSEVVFHDVEGS